MWIELTPYLDGNSNPSHFLMVDTEEHTKDGDHRGVRNSTVARKLLEKLAHEHAQEKEQGDVLFGGVVMVLGVLPISIALFTMSCLAMSLSSKGISMALRV